MVNDEGEVRLHPINLSNANAFPIEKKNWAKNTNDPICHSW